jgi:hypothetical protein
VNESIPQSATDRCSFSGPPLNFAPDGPASAATTLSVVGGGPYSLRIAAISWRPLGTYEPQNVGLSSAFGRYADRRLMIAALGTLLVEKTS